MYVPTRDAYSFGLELLSALFTREEMSNSLVTASTKSEKQALDKVKVNCLLKIIFASSHFFIKGGQIISVGKEKIRGRSPHKRVD